MRAKVIFLFLAIVFLTVNAFADTIVLKSGKQIEGKILERTNDSVKVDFEGVNLTYFFDEVETINGEKVSIVQEPKPEEVAPAVTQPTGSEFNEDVLENLRETVKEKAAALPKLYKSNPKLKMATGIAGLATVGIIFLIIVISLLVYVYSSFCLQIIAKKTNQGPIWLAWVPIGNLFLMCKIANLSYLWLLTILAAFIPFIGNVIILAFSAFVWYKIALVRNKPGWIGALSFLPLVNFIVIGYLAFSD